MNKKFTQTAVILLFIALFVAMTFPLIFRLSSSIPGFYSTDESYSNIWNSWFVEYASKEHLSIGSTDFIGYPFGVKIFDRISGYVFFIINYPLILFTTPILTYNLQIILNVLLTAFITYSLAFYLTRDKAAAIFSGIAYGFCPYMLIRSWQHIGETYLWPIPLFILLALRLYNEGNLRLKLYFILTFILTTVNFDVTYYTLVALSVLLVWGTLISGGSLKYAKRLVVLLSFASAFFIIQFLPLLENLLSGSQAPAAAQNIYRRPFEDLFSQSAKPLSYLLPPTAHPIFGRFTEQFIGSQLYGISLTEHTLYLGWAVLILAFIALRKRGSYKLEERRYILLFFFIALVGWFFSQPPWWSIGRLKIYMPSFLMYKIFPMIRAYCRFGALVMFAASILGGIGLKYILGKTKDSRLRMITAGAFCLIVIFEFWSYPPFKVINVSTVPRVYYWLKVMPNDTVIAEYPLDLAGPSELYKLYQTKHEKKMINGISPIAPEHKILSSINRLSELRTAGVLKWLGVKYVFVHRDDFINTGLQADKLDLENIPKNPGLKFMRSFAAEECPGKDEMCVKRTGQIDVYEVVSRVAIEPKIK